MNDIETSYDAKNEQNRRRAREVNGAVHTIKATMDKSRTTFPIMGVEGIIDELSFPSADVRGEVELRKQPAYRCELCLMPAHAHAVFGGEVPHDPVLRHEDYRVAGVTPGTEQYDENYADSPNVRARYIGGEPQLDVQMTENEMEDAASRWHRATRRHRADPDNPANW